MIPLGLCDYQHCVNFDLDMQLQTFSFRDNRRLLFSTDRLEFRAELFLQVALNVDGTRVLSLDGLDIHLHWQSKLDEGRADYLEFLEPVFLLTFLAGFHYSLISEALKTIDGWHDYFVRDDYGIPLRETFGHIPLAATQEAADIQAAARREALERAARNHLQNLAP